MNIAFDTFNQDQNDGSTHPFTLSHTGTGSNLAAVVHVVGGQSGDGDIITGCTYDGVAMTQLQKFTIGTGTDRYEYLFYLSNVPSGAKNVTVAASGNVFIRIYCATYTGVNPGAIDNSTVSLNNSAATDQTVSLTPSADNTWIAAFFTSNGSSTYSSGTNWTAHSPVGGAARGFGDTNGAITPAGSTTLHASSSASLAYDVWAASMAPNTFGLINVSDSSAVTDTPRISTIVLVSAADSTAVTDTVSIQRFFVFAVSDTVTMSEVFVSTFIWPNQSKNTSVFTNQTPSSSIWTDQNPNTSVFTNQSKS